MNIPTSIVLWVGLGLFIVLFLIAAAHVIQGVRYSQGDRHILVATFIFTLTFVIITGVAGLLTQSIDWTSSWTIEFPRSASDTTE